MAVPSYFRQTPFLTALYNQGMARHASPLEIAGFAGNSWQESKGRSDALQKGGHAIGAMQWDDRRPALEAFARQRGTSWDDPDTQAAFVYHELDTTEGRARRAFEAARTPEEAAIAGLQYERPAGWGQPNWQNHPTLGWNTRNSESQKAYASIMGQRAEGPTVDGSEPPPMTAAMGGGAPGGAQSQSPLQSVLIGGQTSGDSEWDRLDNIGSGLQSAGAAIMAISNPQGAAALARLADRGAKKGWTYAGTTPNGMGMIMKGPNGETRIDPIPAGYAGESQANLPSGVREFQYAQSNPQYKEWLKEREGITNPQDPAPDPDSLKMFGMDYLINGNQAALKDVPQKQRSEALRLAKEQFKADTGQDYDPTDLALRRGAYQELIAESRKFGQMLGPTQTAHDRLMADIKIAKERIADLPTELNNSNLPWNKFRQMTAEQLQEAGFGKLAQAREAIYNVERGYSAVQANGMRSGDTVAAQKRAEGLINSAMSPDVLLGQVGKDGQRSGGLLDFMGDSANRILDNVKGGQKRLREEWKKGAQEFGSRLSQEEAKLTRDIESRAAPQQQQQGQPQGGPVRVNSIEEAQKLAPGTQFLTPDGRLKIR